MSFPAACLAKNGFLYFTLNASLSPMALKKD